MSSPHRLNPFLAALALLVALTPAVAQAQLRVFPGSDAFSLGRIDDSPSAGPVSLGFAANFFGTTYSQLWVNNNGNVTFDGAFDDPFGSYAPLPEGLAATARVIIAPFFADVDTTAPDSGIVTFGRGVLAGRNALAVNYVGVAPYFQLPVYNTFQLVLIDRADTGLGNFDIEFNYGAIAWESGQATGGNALGLGGYAARAGYSDGTTAHTFELPGSGTNGAFLDTNPSTGLRYSPSGVDFEVRGGIPRTVGAVPEPATYGLTAALLMLGAIAWRPRADRRIAS
jgi:hypothetical protein